MRIQTKRRGEKLEYKFINNNNQQQWLQKGHVGEVQIGDIVVNRKFESNGFRRYDYRTFEEVIEICDDYVITKEIGGE